MNEQYQFQMFETEEVAWCRGERDSMVRELIRYRDRLYAFRGRRTESLFSAGARVHITYLISAIHHMDDFIAANSLNVRRQARQSRAGVGMLVPSIIPICAP